MSLGQPMATPNKFWMLTADFFSFTEVRSEKLSSAFSSILCVLCALRGFQNINRTAMIVYDRKQIVNQQYS